MILGMKCTVFCPIHTQSGKLGKPAEPPQERQEKEKPVGFLPPTGKILFSYSS
jgi:hypothetical protein